jgi:monoamine oxidase
MKRRSDRRQFLKTASLATAGASVLGAPAVAAGPGNRTLPTLAADVVVVGAGFGGMVAAYRLHQMGHSVIVVDAMNRVGGRSWSTTLSDGTLLDIGAGWTSSTEYNILALVRELGLLTYTQYGLGDNQGLNLFVGSNGTVSTYTGLNFPVSQTAKDQIALAIGTIDTLMQTVPLDAPWTAPNAVEWDNVSAGVFASGLVTDSDALAVVFANLTTIFGLSPYAVSFLHLLWDSHAAGGVEKFGPVVGGSVEFRIVGGTQQIPLEIARRLGKGAFLVNSPVRELNQDDTGVTVVSELATLRARRVVVAIPTCLTGFIRYNPILPSDRAQLTQRTCQGSAMKIQLVYDRAFWRDAGLNGNSLAINGSIVPQTLDAGGPAGVNTPGILACFVDDDGARDLGRLSQTERKNRVIQELIPRFTSQVTALSTRITPNYFELSSQDLEWIRGDYGSTPGPRVLTASGFGPAIRAPFGRIHWAGVDTATIWFQSIDGAAQSGNRAALEVVNAGL